MYGRHRFGGIAHTTVALALQPVSGLSRPCVCGTCPACATFPFAPPAHGCHARESHSRSPAGKALDAFLSWRRVCLQATVQALSQTRAALTESECRTPPSSRPTAQAIQLTGIHRSALPTELIGAQASRLTSSIARHGSRHRCRSVPPVNPDHHQCQESVLGLDARRHRRWSSVFRSIKAGAMRSNAKAKFDH